MIDPLEGGPMPRGATWDGNGTNFSIFSAHATKVEVCLFDATGEKEVERVSLPEYTDQIWHGYLPGIHPGRHMDIVSMVLMSPRPGIALIRINWYSIRMPMPIWASSVESRAVRLSDGIR